MAIATSYKTVDKNALLEKINALVWALQYLSASGALPSKEYLALKLPQLSREKLLWHLGCKTEDEVIAKLGGLRLKFEGLQQTLAQETNTPDEIKQIPPEVIQSGIFAGQKEEEVGKSILSSLSDLQKEPVGEDLKLIEPPERKIIQATLVNPHASFSPTYNEAAEILAQAGLINENGEPQPQYKNLLSDPEFKVEVERKLMLAILTQELESQIIAQLDEKFTSTQAPHELIQKEFNFAKKQIAELYAQEALSQLSAAGNDAVSLSQASQAAKGAVAAKIEKDKESLPRFFDEILATNPNLEKDAALRKETVTQLSSAAFAALGAFVPDQNVWVSLGDDLPRIACAHYFLDEEGKLKRNLYEYWTLPKTPETQEKEIEEEKNDQEVMLAALYKKTSTIPNPNIGKYVGQERPKPKTVWPYFVAAPLVTGWAITDPVGAITFMPYGATAIAAYVGIKKVTEKVETFKKKLKPFLNPAEYLHKNYSQAVQRLLFQQIPAKALRMTPLYKNYDIKGPDGRIYQYAEFRPARLLRTGAVKVLGKFAGDKTGSVRNRIFSRAKENITPKVNLRSKKVEKKYHGLLGIIIGVALVDILAGAIWELAKDRIVMLSKVERVLGPAGRTVKSAFSLNTAAGAYTGFLIGAPFGLSTPLAVVGGLGGWGWQEAKNWAKNSDFLLRQTQREQLLAEGKLVSRWERVVTRVGRVPRLLARYPLVENLPLKGAAFGYMVGGVPGAITWGSLQTLWANRAWMGFQLQTAAHEFVWEASGGRYADLSHFAQTGPRWARPLKYARYLPKYLPGAGVGGAIGFLATGGGVQGLLVGAAIGYGTHMAASLAIKAITAITRTATQAIAHQIKMFYTRYPYAKGGTLGLGLGIILVTLGVPIWAAIPIGIGAGMSLQWLWRRIFGRGGTEVAAEVAEAAGTRTLAGGLRFFVGKLIGAFTGIGTVFAAFDLARGLLRFDLEHYMSDYETWKKSLWGGGGTYLQYRIEKWFAQNLVKVLNAILWPWDKFWDWFFGPVWSSFLGPLLVKAYGVGEFLLGWTRNLPGFLGSWARKAGGFLGGVKDAITGGVKAVTGVLMGLLAGLVQLLMGGDIAEAALAAAVGLALAGSIVNTQTINSAFVATPAAFQQQKPTPFADLTKTAQTQNPDKGPSQSISIENRDLEPNGKPVLFAVRLVAKNNLSGLSCTDEAVLTKKDGTTETLPIPPIPLCPPNLPSGQEFSFSFSITAQNEDKYKDAILKNTFRVNGDAKVSGADYWIPIRDTTVRPFGGNTSALDNFKNFVRANYPNNMIDTNCFGQSCWDFVISQSTAAGANPTFLLAVWYEESHFSDVGNHFSCPASIARPHTPEGLRDSLNCFLTQIINGRQNTAEGFIDAMHQYCGTGSWSPDPSNPLALCSNNTNFLSQLGSAYQDLGGSIIPLAGGSTQSFNTQATAVVFIGNPPNDICNLFNFVGGWTDPEKTYVQGVCLTVATSPQFVSLVRNAGVVIMERVPNGSLGGGVCGAVNGANAVSIACTFTNQPFANYVIIHEVGHVVGNYNSDVYNNYEDIYNQEGLLPTYPFDCRPCQDEGFAEMIADNVVYKTYNFLARSWSGYPGGVFNSYPSSYPLHFNFAKQEIFGGVTF